MSPTPTSALRMLRLLGRLGFPDTLQERLRWLCVVVAALAALGAVGGVLASDVAPLWRAGGLLALLVMVTTRWATYRRGSRSRGADVLEALTVLVLAATLATPQQVNALVHPGVWFRSLYGTHRDAAWYVGLQVAAILTGVALSPTAHALGLSVVDPTILGVLPALVGTACLVRVLCTSLAAQERAAERERVLSGTSSALLPATGPAQIHALVHSAVQVLVGSAPGARVVLELPSGDAGPGPLAGVLARAPGPLPSSPSTAAPAVARALEQLPGPHGAGAAPGGHWQVAVVDGDAADGCVAVRTPHGLRPDVAKALGTLLAAGVQAARRTRAEQELAHRAWHDSLTGLANRGQYQDRVRTVHQLRAAGGGRFAVALLDLDDFKTVNDTLGHAAGDELLRVVAQRLTSAVRGGDVVARLGGDEFAVLLPDTTTAEQAQGFAARVLAVLDAPVLLEGRVLHLGASVGLALSEPGLGLEELLRRADVAMYAAKAAGKDQVALFDPERHGAFIGTTA